MHCIKNTAAAAAAAAANKNKPSSSGSTTSSGFRFPLAYSTGVTCAYGPRIHPINGNKSFHYGVDLAAGMGTEIYATKSGTVAQVAVSKGAVVETGAPLVVIA